MFASGPACSDIWGLKWPPADIASGELAIGYNMLGSYAVGALRRGAPIGIVVPRDRALVLSRAAMIPRQAANASGAKRFLDYLLSERGHEFGHEGFPGVGREQQWP